MPMPYPDDIGVARGIIKPMKRPAPSLSIVIPVFNEQSDIGACLDAISRQTEPPDEVVVVDNNCTDESIKIAKTYPFVRVVSEGRQGIVYARNRGFDSAQSQIIGRIDADSRLRPGWVKTVKKFYQSESHADHAVTGRGYFYNLKWPIFAGMVQYDIAFVYNRLILGSYILWGSNMAIPRTVWDKVKSQTLSRTDVHEDIDLAIVLQKNGYKVDYRKSMVAGVRMRRVHSDRNKLWSNLMLWPRTFRVRGNKKWPLAYLGAVFLFLCSAPLRIIEHLTIATVNRPKRKRI